MLVGQRTKAQEVEWANALNRIKGASEVASKVAKTMGQTYQAGFTKHQPSAPNGFGLHYEGARPSWSAHANMRERTPSNVLEGGAISNDFARKLIANRIAQLDAQKSQTTDVGTPQTQSVSSPEGAAVTQRVEAALSALSVSLEAGLFTGSAIVDPAKEALSALLSGASELGVDEIDSILDTIEKITDAVDFSKDDSVGGKVGEISRACTILLQSCEFVLDSQRVEALRGDSVLARRHSLKVERTQLARSRLSSLGRAQAHIKAAARDAAASRGHVAPFASASPSASAAATASGTEENEDGWPAISSEPIEGIWADVPSTSGRSPGRIVRPKKESGYASSSASYGPGAAEEDEEREETYAEAPQETSRYDTFRAAVESATNKREALEALQWYESSIGADPSNYNPDSKKSLQTVKKNILKLYPQP